jgi:hypothetical protein
VGDDVRIGGEIHVLVHRPAWPLLAERRGDSLRTDPPIAVPLGSAVPQSHAVITSFTGANGPSRKRL